MVANIKQPAGDLPYLWRIKKAIRQKDIGVFQSVLLVICSVVFILFLIILTVVIIHMINNIPL